MTASDIKPLAGKSVVVTRAREQAGELTERLSELGAEVLLLPSVSFTDPEDTRPLDEALRHLEDFDWVILTSQNAVHYFCKRCRALGVQVPGGSCRPAYAAVGRGTARAVEQEGLAVSAVPSRFTGDALAKEMAPGMGGKRILLPRSDRARPDLPEALRRAGAEVTDVVAYRTLAAEPADPQLLEHLRQGRVEVVTFASPSAFHHLCDELGTEDVARLSKQAAFAAIGPVTAGAIRDAGMQVAIEAPESTAAGLVQAIAAHFTKESPTGANLP